MFGPDITLIGYYGYRNLGDDLMLSHLLGRIARTTTARVAVCSCSRLPFQTPPRVTTIVTPSLRGRMRKAAALIAARTVVWGGGTCLYEDGPGGVAGLRGIRRVQRICRRTGTDFVLLGVGIGTLHTDTGRALARAIVADADGLYCRDEQSADRARDLTPAADARPAGDLAFLEPPVARTAAASTDGPRTVAFCGASYFSDDPDTVAAYRNMVASWLAAGVERILFVPMHQGAATDHAFHRAVAADLPPASYSLAAYDTIADGMDLLRTADVAVSFRLHGLALADMLGVPCFGVDYSPKVASYLARCDGDGSPRLRAVGEAIDFADLARSLRTAGAHRARIGEFVRLESSAAADAVDDMLRRHGHV